MPIGKDSIRKRVIGAECEDCGSCEKKPVAGTKDNKAGKATKTTATNTVNTNTKKAPAKRAPAQKKPAASTEPVAAPSVTESVLTNVSPAVVEAVVGHKENECVEHIQILDDMPHYLL